MTYAWKIIGLKMKNVESLTGFVSRAYWKKTGTDDNNVIGEVMGETAFSSDDIDPSTFISSLNLTEELVVTWVKDKISENLGDQAIDDQILNQIKEKKAMETTISEGNFPWSIKKA
jgi:hypothetical protein